MHQDGSDEDMVDVKFRVPLSLSHALDRFIADENKNARGKISRSAALHYILEQFVLSYDRYRKDVDKHRKAGAPNVIDFAQAIARLRDE